MSKDMKMIPELRFPEFENEVEWDLKEFSKFIKLDRGSSPRPIQDYLTQDESGVNWIKIGDTKNAVNSVLYQVEEKITLKGAEKSRKVEKGELILANSMSFGKTYQLAIEGCIYDGWFVLRKYENNFNKPFLLQLLNSDFMQNQYKKLSAGGIVQNISSDIVYNSKLYHTTLPEQQKIASCLSSLDEVIAAHSQKLELLKDHKKGLMQNLFPQPSELGFDRLKDDRIEKGNKKILQSSNPKNHNSDNVPKYRFKEFENDGEWVEKKLGEILEFKNGINAAREQYGKGIKFINVLDILNNEFIIYENIIGSVDIDESTLQKNSVTFGDILFQRSSETQEEVGTANVYLDKDNTATFGGFVIRGKKIGDYEPAFLNALLKTREIRNSISSKAGGSTRFNVGQETLASTTILLPTIQEQQKIASCLSSLDALIAAQAEKIEQLQLHKKGLMQGLFPRMSEL
ncbi:restriction endonuclease subunit S [Mongoliitalea lutea]|uniref:Type I restriction modification DNA specificity domain-containing protein n=1 Tax=Mongoliitalea lutea TaxID=849756 RepID=A0A8J3G6F7_9BACT|nr:restriction endonuclease subunit S [Mongoliitalea lutea]GHB47381.1 hypothetical protein GCM10008106_30420 [Mongoliitalea lutea]